MALELSFFGERGNSLQSGPRCRALRKEKSGFEDEIDCGRTYALARRNAVGLNL